MAVLVNSDRTMLCVCTFFLLWVQFVTGQDPSGNNDSVSNYEPEDNNGPMVLSFPWPSECQITVTDPFTHNKVKELIDRHTKLVEYNLVFPNYNFNPLRTNTTWSYQADGWARVTNLHGQTLLSLAFNYGVMSMMTLTFGVEALVVNLTDTPAGCFGKLQENIKINTLLHLLMRDFRDTGDLTFTGDERVCHEVISPEGGYAKFRDRCCFIDRVHKEKQCSTSHRNIWLAVIYLLLGVVRFMVLFCGPLLFLSTVMENAMECVPYVVKLKEPLKKKMFLCRADTPIDVTYKRELNLRKQKGFHKLRESVSNMQIGQIIETQISQYDILVDYNRLLPENQVPVGLLRCLGRAIFMCKMKTLGPCRPCCDANMLQPYASRAPAPWIDLCGRVGKALLILLIPSPLYIRIAVYYLFEHQEVIDRKVAVDKMGLSETYENSMMHFMGPLHPLFVIIYIVCTVAAVVLAYFATSNRGSYFKHIIVSAFRDLKRMSWLKALEITVSNFLWPFRRFGLMGCVVALAYWPVALVVCAVVWAVYVLPTFYLTFRLLYHSRLAILSNTKKRRNRYKVEKTLDQSIQHFETEAMLETVCPKDDGGILEWKDDEYTPLQRKKAKIAPLSASNNKQKIIEHTLAAILLILAMYGGLILLSECLGFLVEVLVFTLMGIILNAGSMLKFVSLIFLVIVYSYDCYNNVNKKYLKLNKSLFGEIKDRIKDLKDVTSLPSSLQENCGFKSVENSEQKEHEKPDDLVEKATARQWMINDLILFIDNEDMPRIPHQLFDEVCEIRVAGSPGPIYASLLAATKDFLKIVCFLFFVFLIVLSFGEVYQVSATNQSLATMAGGFLPLILRNFMQPRRPDIELGTVSFKSKLDEIIQNFYQNWPIFDFPFEEPAEEESEEESDSDSGSESSDKDEKKKKKKDKNKDGKDKKEGKDKSQKGDKKSESKEEENESGRRDKDERNRLEGLGIDGIDQVDSAKDVKRPNSIEKVKFEEEEGGVEGEDKEKFDVDILVHLPEVTLDWWLDEWSDVVDLEGGVPMKRVNNNIV